MKKLSLVGRIMLTRAIMLSIPNYFISTVCVLVFICREIEKLA